MKNKPVTEESFKKAMDHIDDRFNGVDERIKHLSTIAIRHELKLEDMEKIMATKSDIQKLVNLMDHQGGEMEILRRKYLVHDHRINELEDKTKHLP